MDADNFRSLLDKAQDESCWLVAPGLAGQSPALRSFVEKWRIAAGKFHHIPHSGGQCGAILVRPSGFDRLDKDLLHAAGISRIEHVRLFHGANLYNARRLFGIASKPGVFESPGEPIIVVGGIEYLTTDLQTRLLRHLDAWWLNQGQAERRPFHLIVLLDGTGPQPLYQGLAKVSPTADWNRVPALADRIEDIPFCLHYEARFCGGSLADFGLENLLRLMSYPWRGDLGELYRFVHRLYTPSPSQSRSLSWGMIEGALSGGALDNSSHVSTALPDWQAVWIDIDSLHKHCNRRTHALINVPFFAPGTTEAAADPSWNSYSPDLIFLQLVSWAYRKIVEEAEPNLRLVLSIHEQVFHGGRKSRDICDVIAKLRTYEQHRLENESPHDMATRTAVQEWFKRACGDPVPEAWQVELCITTLLADLKDLLEQILSVLRQIENDALRNVLVEQWTKRRETTWPKHRYVTLVSDVLRLVGRLEGPNSLSPTAVTERLLTRMQEQLLVIGEVDDKEERLRRWLEKLIAGEFPETMPFSARDLEEMALPPGPIYKKLLGKIKAEHDEKKSSREDLLALAKQLVDGYLAKEGNAPEQE